MTQYDCSGGGQTGFSCWSVNEEIEKGDESREFSCETLFDSEDLPEFPAGHATNAPDFSHILPLPQIEEVQCKYSPYSVHVQCRTTYSCELYEKYTLFVQILLTQPV